MRNIRRLIFAIALIPLVLVACKKEVSDVHAIPITSLTLVNGVPTSSGLIATFAPDSAVGTFFSTTPLVAYQSGNEYSLPSGNTPVIIYQTSDTSLPFLNAQFGFQGNAIYSLFLSGQVVTQNVPDTLLVEDFPPFHPATDSSVGIRFVNLASGGGSVSVDIMGNSPGSEVGSLAYQGITNFKSYSVTSTVPDPSTGYIFEFRAIGSDSLLATFYYNYGSIALFKNVTIALSGVNTPNSAYPLGTFLINNY